VNHEQEETTSTITIIATMTTPTTPIKVIIIGGGIAGLALAAGLLKKPHITFHIYESVSSYQDVGAGLALHMNAIQAMGQLGPDVQRAYFDAALDMGEEHEEMATEVILAQGPHQGELVAELGRAKGRKSVSRADLLKGFLGLIPAERITLGARLARIKEDADASGSLGQVTATFQDGEKVYGDCLIGADGIHGLTRSYILGADHPATKPVNHDGWQIYRTMISVEEAQKQHGLETRWMKIVSILLGPQGHINTLPLNKSTRLSAGVAVRGAKFTESGIAPDLDPSLYSEYSEEAQKIVRMVARDTSASWTAADHDHAPIYFQGRVCMIGDSAHASLPFAGNGAAQALEDCTVIDHLFAALETPEQISVAFAAYDAVRRPRSQAVVDLARKFGRVYAYAESDMLNRPEKMRAFFKDAAAFTNNFDVQKQNDDAMTLMKKWLRETRT
jgi:salicylate hydroxylase